MPEITIKAEVIEIRPGRYRIRKRGFLWSPTRWWSEDGMYPENAKTFWTKRKADRQCELINKHNL